MEFVKEVKRHVFDVSAFVLSAPYLIENLTTNKTVYGILATVSDDKLTFIRHELNGDRVIHFDVSVDNVVKGWLKIHKCVVIDQTNASKPSGILGENMNDGYAVSEPDPINGMRYTVPTPPQDPEAVKRAFADTLNVTPEEAGDFQEYGDIIKSLSRIQGDAKPTGSEVI